MRGQYSRAACPSQARLSRTRKHTVKVINDMVCLCSNFSVEEFIKHLLDIVSHRRCIRRVLMLRLSTTNTLVGALACIVTHSVDG